VMTFADLVLECGADRGPMTDNAWCSYTIAP
jgi:hypothetical protein